ncbi:MAG: aminotransferase class I/II-fold pyridoxal phosphate-dependent enzyme [Gammaproteobacteria bacterium]
MDSVYYGSSLCLGRSSGSPFRSKSDRGIAGFPTRDFRPVDTASVLGSFRFAREGRIVIYLDAGAYPISRWGVERAAALGTPVRLFQHQDAKHVARLLRVDARLGRQPVIVSDGFCTGCGRAAPLPAYLKIVRRFGGYLVIDDTQALGIFGRNPDRHPPYGLGGGGILRWYGIKDPRVINVSSLAKGYGAPIAVLSGNERLVRCFEANSETRIHTSPPSIATIRAVEHALAINRKNGDDLRSRLAQRVAQFRKLMKNAGIISRGGFFPVQTIKVPEKGAERIYRNLREQGVLSILKQCCGSRKPCIAL